MTRSTSNKRTKPNKVVASSISPSKAPVMPGVGSSQNTIRERAYELYENRGGEPGQDKQDWLHAEQEILISATASLAEDRRSVWAA